MTKHCECLVDYGEPCCFCGYDAEQVAVFLPCVDYMANRDCKLRNREPPDPPGWEGGFADNH